MPKHGTPLDDEIAAARAAFYAAKADWRAAHRSGRRIGPAAGRRRQERIDRLGDELAALILRRDAIVAGRTLLGRTLRLSIAEGASS